MEASKQREEEEEKKLFWSLGYTHTPATHAHITPLDEQRKKAFSSPFIKKKPKKYAVIRKDSFPLCELGRKGEEEAYLVDLAGGEKRRL